MNEWPKRIKMYVHGDRMRSLEKGEELGLSDEALGFFKYALAEVEIELDVFENGRGEIVAVDGRKLEGADR